SERAVNFIAINPQLQKTQLRNIKIELSTLQPISTLVKNPDGTYEYQSLIQTKVISTNAFTLEEQGTNFTLPTQEVGDFVVKVLDQNNIELSKFKYTVAGESQLPVAKNAE